MSHCFSLFGRQDFAVIQKSESIQKVGGTGENGGSVKRERPCVRGVGGRLKAGRCARAPRPAGRDGLGRPVRHHCTICGTTVQYAPLISPGIPPPCCICRAYRICKEASEAPRLGFAFSQPLQVLCRESFFFCHFYGTIYFDSKMREANTLAIICSLKLGLVSFCGLNHWLEL